MAPTREWKASVKAFKFQELGGETRHYSAVGQSARRRVGVAGAAWGASSAGLETTRHAPDDVRLRLGQQEAHLVES